MVVWAQEHLIGGRGRVPVTGIFGRQTRAAVRAFQEAHGLPVDGVIGTDTWGALLKLRARPRAHGRRRPASASTVGRRGAGARGRSRPRCRRGATSSSPAPQLAPDAVPDTRTSVEGQRRGLAGDPRRQPAQRRRLTTISSPSCSQTRGLRAPPTPVRRPGGDDVAGLERHQPERWDDAGGDREDQVVGASRSASARRSG